MATEMGANGAYRTAVGAIALHVFNGVEHDSYLGK